MPNARGLLAQHGEQRVQKFDQLLARICPLTEQLQQSLTVCLLGNSGVGKSTLPNALVADARTVVPQGGHTPSHGPGHSGPVRGRALF